MHYTSEAKAQIAGEYVLGLAPRPLVRAIERRLPRDAELERLVVQWRAHLHELGSAVPATLPMRDEVWTRIAAALPQADVPVPAAATPARADVGRSWWQQLWLWQGWAVAASAAVLVLGLQPQLSVSGPEPSTAAVPVGLQQAPPTQAPSADPTNTAPSAANAAAANSSPNTDAADAAGSTANQQSQRFADGAPAAVSSMASADSAATELVASAAGPVEARARTTRGLDAALPSARTATEQLALVGVLATEEGGAAWLVRLDQASGVLKVRVLAMQNAGAEHDFELWAVPKDGGPPRSLGVIAGDRDITLPMDSRANRSVRQAQLLAVSVEPAGGSPVAGPSGPVKFTGAMLQI